MSDRAAQLELLLDLESRQDEVLLRLDELDRRVEKTLGECLSLRAAEIPPTTQADAA
jgi:tetrahydromethanopterin S-methyltransferase subunit G